ncbi:tol-pal system YbgF family protein [candidate division KSB1 bacterium]
MLAPRKKVSRKQLKEDPMMKTINKVTVFLQNEWQKILSGAMVVLLIIFVATWVQKSSLEREQNATTELYPYEDRYMNEVYDDQLIAGLNTIIERYKDTEAGNRAAFFLGNTYFNMGNYEQAELQFNVFLNEHDGNDFMKCSALNGIAATYEQREMYNQAAEKYNDAVKSYPNTFLVPEALLGAARSYEKLGQLEEAKARCERILNDFPDTPQAEEAEVIKARL